MLGRAAIDGGPVYQRAIRAIRAGPLVGRWLFAWVFLAQLGHLIEHISVAIQGKALLGSQFDSELSHLLTYTSTTSF